MSHSTHVGFRAPLSSSGVVMDRSLARAPLPPHLHIAAPPVFVIAVGVGHRFRCAAHFCIEGAIMFALAVGVGSRAMAASDGRTFAPGLGDWLLPYCCAVGVGNDPHAISAVRGADGGSWYAVPRRIVPERGQVSEYDPHPSSKERWDVFHDDVAGS